MNVSPTHLHEYRWRDWMRFFLLSRILIDDEKQTVTFENCLRSKSFLNLMPLSSISFTWDEILDSLKAGTADDGDRFFIVETASVRSVFLASCVPNFDELVFRLQSLNSPSTQVD
jgi:hypothetical protein